MLKAISFLLVAPAVSGLILFSAGPALAEDETAATAADEPVVLDGVETAEPTALPSNFGLWWRGWRERVSLALTFDSVKKSEKALLFAEERVRLADYITQNADDPKIQEKAQQMLAKANQYMEKIQERQSDLINNGGERAKILLGNLAAHYANQERVMEKLEDKLPPEKLEQFQSSRRSAEARTEAFLSRLAEHQNVPAEVKEKIIRTKERVGEKLKAREEFRTEQKDILEKIRAGSQAAREELKQLRERKIKSLNRLNQIGEENSGQ
ncbi:MAG: DUF5667 domain-containing protein [bacterium]|nr:DUF5667 domain-containing protein [bacterium]